VHIRPHQKLIVWQEAYKLCLFVHRLTVGFPSYEKFGLANQIRKSISSVPLNIAEGNAKGTHPDKLRFLDIAFGSLEESHCTAQLSKDLGYITSVQFERIDERIHRVSYLLTKLRASLGG
jgi:four helix bundle protein